MAKILLAYDGSPRAQIKTEVTFEDGRKGSIEGDVAIIIVDERAVIAGILWKRLDGTIDRRFQFALRGHGVGDAGAVADGQVADAVRPSVVGADEQALA